MRPSARVAHRTTEIDGVGIFYREAGPPDAPVVLLPHGYPCSSFQFRHVVPALVDRWRLIAPLDEVVALARGFLGRMHAGPAIAGR